MQTYDNDLPDPDEEDEEGEDDIESEAEAQDRFDRYNRGERTDICEDCRVKFTHMGGDTRLTCDSCQALRRKKEKQEDFIYASKRFGPPLVSLGLTTVVMGPMAPALLFVITWVFTSMAGYGLLIFAELGWILGKAASRFPKFWRQRRFWTRLLAILFLLGISMVFLGISWWISC